MALEFEIKDKEPDRSNDSNNENTNTIKTPTLCLNMIVKNESKIIERLLKSVLPIIDCYCICDTGSTDNTIEIIETFFESKNISGKIVKEPFKNFSYNRNVALKSCIGMSDYVILLDADMILEIRSPFDKSVLLTGDAFSILQGCNEFYYENVRIIKNNGRVEYVCVTHEYLSLPEDSINYHIHKSLLFITDIGDGGSKSDKYERDIRLLLEGLNEDPNNTRYKFYLANSYHDCGQYENAIEYYKKRIDSGGWIQETWYSYYRIGLCYKNMNKMADAINAWLEASNIIPERVENIYEILMYYRLTSKYFLAMMFYHVAKKICETSTNRDRFLFLHNDIYTCRIDYEFTIIALYNGYNNINKEVVKVLNISNDMNIKLNIIFNMKYYKDIWVPKRSINMTNSTTRLWNGETVKLNSSSSCIIKDNFAWGGGYIMNVRYVNYEINDKGFYLNCDKNIITFNKLVKLNSNFDTTVEKWFDNDTKDRRYVGIEDVRIFSEIDLDKDDERFLFIGTGFHENNKIGIVHGKYPTNLLSNNPLSSVEITPSFVQTECEKNWVYVDYKGSTHIIYNWHPLIISKVNESNKALLDMKETKNMPNIFKHVRGSTNGCSFGDEIWFVTHLVSYEQPRHYYNMMVVFDLELNLKRYSAPFKFSDQPIEYCLGLVVEEDQVIMTYSVWDRSTIIAIYDKIYINEKIIYKP
jgi:tetratricopeptide (TPR) repeat protein